MTINKKFLIPIIAFAIAGAGFLTSAKVFAQTQDNPMSTLVQKIADKFGLNKDDVQAVFDEDRTERQAQMEARYEQQLSRYVTDGKITEAQKALIIAKHKELTANRQQVRENLSGMTDEERKTAMEEKRTQMQTQRQELEDWASQNGIDVKYLMGGIGLRGGHPGGFGGPGPGGPRSSGTATDGT